MEIRVNGVLIHYVEHGSGVPMLALHGTGVDHREIEAALEAIIPKEGYRRIYPDLPAMGRSAANGLTSNEDVVRLLGDLIDELGIDELLLLGHSYGAYLARGLAAQRPDSVLGLAVICPLGESTGAVPEQSAVVEEAAAYDELETDQCEGFNQYFVVRTPENARRYRDFVVPGTAMVDEDALGRIFTNWGVDVGSAEYSGPTLIVVGRLDSTVGYVGGVELLDAYPHASLAVVEDAGHALMHERPALLASLVNDWLERSKQDQ
jgi:pimeloyl-ACP methyl ester carboxylesterase